jgi:hypothetical protein
MNEQQLAAVKQALEALEMVAARTGARWALEQGYAGHLEAITALQSIISQDALDKKAENARELGLDYEPAVQEPYKGLSEHLSQASGGMVRIDPVTGNVGIGTPEAQPAVQEGRDWSLLEATQESLREHMAEIKRLKAAQPAPVQEPVAWMRNDGKRVTTAAYRHNYPDYETRYSIPLYTTPPAPQPVPVKTYHDGKPWPVAPKPWVGLTDEEKYEAEEGCSYMDEFYRSLYADNIEAKLKEKNHG